jgi:hypothetical protein
VLKSFCFVNGGYSIVDDNFYDWSRPLDGQLVSAIISVYEWRRLPVAPNLFRAGLQVSRDWRAPDVEIDIKRFIVGICPLSRCFEPYKEAMLQELDKYLVLL